MAFTDLIMKDVAAPLSGFDKAVSTGFELAQNQEKIGLAQRQNQLEQEKIQASYLAKANDLLPNLLKTTGKARSLLTNSYMSLMAKGGMPVNKDTMDLLAADESVASDYAAIEDKIRKQYPNDPVRQAAARAQYLGLPPSDVMTQVTGVAKAELGAKYAMERTRFQQSQVAQRQMTGAQVKREDTAQREVSGLIDKTNQYFQGLTPALGQIEGIFGTKDKPKKVEISELKALLPAFARTIGGEKGPLSDDDVKRVLAETLELKVELLADYISGDQKAPEQITNKLRERYSLFKGNLIRETTAKLFDKIEEKQLAPGLEDMFAIEPSGKGLVLGVGARQLIAKANNVLLNNRASLGKFDVYRWVKSQAAPPSSSQILAEIKRRSQVGQITTFGSAAPVKSGLNVYYSEPEAAPEEEQQTDGEE